MTRTGPTDVMSAPVRELCEVSGTSVNTLGPAGCAILRSVSYREAASCAAVTTTWLATDNGNISALPIAKRLVRGCTVVALKGKSA